MKTITPREQRMLDMLTAAADAGQVCPTNDALCATLGMNSVGAPPQIMNKLVARGLIKVERFKQSRIVTIVATGKTTAGKRGDPHHSEEAARNVPAHRLGDEEAIAFKRDLEDWIVRTGSARVRLSLEAMGHTSAVQNALAARNPCRDTAEAFRAAMRRFPKGLPALKKGWLRTTDKRETPEPMMRADELDARRGEAERRHRIHEQKCLQDHRRKYGSAPFGKPLDRMVV
ncbi:hypothetical protein [Sphingorhabdus sp. 109]|uniref:hypothetical protein n=1 Tax=Sphingorhabdus sp. 109 TaxID=2653173 RepID=UPI0012EF4F59|nr:hypothetical protein [Sphingorhabdus sp. 109]VWX56698.1 hypothetical protein SPHINGOR109_10552 [Sphingorhabdus sp. 109]